MGRFYAITMYQIGKQCEDLVEHFLTKALATDSDSNGCTTKQITGSVTSNNKFAHIRIKIKISGRRQTFARFSFKVSDKFELEYVRKTLRDFAFMSKYHDLPADNSSTEAYSSSD